MIVHVASGNIYAAKAGRSFTMPMAPGVATWLMSVPCCVDNLLHAAAIPAGELPAQRSWTLPTFRVSMSDLVDGLASLYGASVKDRFAYAPDSAVEGIFGQPPITTAMADRLGFWNDGDIVTLIRRAMSVS